MKKYICLVLHAALGVGFICWFITMIGVLVFLIRNRKKSPDQKLNDIAQSLSESLLTVHRWTAVFAMVDLIAHILAWLYNLNIMDIPFADSMYLLIIVCFLGGLFGMLVFTFVMLAHNNSYKDLMKATRRLPCTLIIIGVLSIIVLAFLSY